MLLSLTVIFLISSDSNLIMRACFSYAFFSITSVTSFALSSKTTGTFSLIIPAFSPAISAKVSPKKIETLKYDVCDQMASQVVADAVRLMKNWGILLPEGYEIVFCDDVNCHMCQVENLHDGTVY